MKNKFFNYSLQFLVFSFLFSCGEPLMNYDINTKTPIVESYLQEGSNILKVKIFSIEEYSKDEVNLSKPISQLKVKINQIELPETSKGIYQLDLGTDTIRGGQIFNLQFNYNGKSVEASTTVPSQIKSLVVTPQIFEYNPTDYYYNYNDTTRVIVSWDDPDKSFYQVYIESPGTSEILTSGIFRRRTMQPFKGNSYRASVREFRSIGNHTFHVYRIGKDYAELYERVSASDLANPVSYITNAFGIFTSMSIAKVNFKVVEKSDSQ